MGNKTPEISSSEAVELEQFLLDTTLFLAPDPEIMGTHDLAPRTQREERILKQDVDPTQLLLIRDRLLAGANEAFEMMEQMGAAPGAKWRRSRSASSAIASSAVPMPIQ